MRRASKWLKHHFDPSSGWIRNSPEGKSINNLGTGLTLGGKSNLVVGGVGAAAGGIYLATAPGRQQKREVMGQSEYQDVESLPSTRADGMGYYTNPQNSGMGSDGSLVFAMNKTRHGGYL